MKSKRLHQVALAVGLGLVAGSSWAELGVADGFTGPVGLTVDAIGGTVNKVFTMPASGLPESTAPALVLSALAALALIRRPKR